MKLRFDDKTCTGCCACAIACMDQRDIDVEAGQRPLRRVEQSEVQGVLRFRSVGCVHCADMPCVAACPQGCISRDAYGLVQCDNTACIGCRRCAAACPLDVISFLPQSGKMIKCDGCVGRVLDGRLPACVHSCPTGALTVEGL